MHLCDESHPLLVAFHFGQRSDGLELQAGVVGIRVHGKGGQRQEVDAVALLECCQVGEAQGEAQDDGDAGILTGCRTHPKGVMIAPLQVEIVAREQVIHDDMRPWPAVEDVAKDVQLVDAQLVDDVTDSDDEVSGLSYLHDCLDNPLHISIFIFVVRTLVEEFLDDVGELFRQGFADLAAGVFAAHGLADLYELQQGSGVEAGEVFVRALLNHLEPLFGIVDEGAEVAHLLLRERFVEQVVDLPLDVSAGIPENMQEGFMLAMNVGDEVFGTFRKAENRLKVYDFRACALTIGERSGKQLEQTHIRIVHNS